MVVDEDITSKKNPSKHLQSTSDTPKNSKVRAQPGTDPGRSSKEIRFIITRNSVPILAFLLVLLLLVVTLDELQILSDNKNNNVPLETVYEPIIVPADFSNNITHPYLPFKPGNHWRYEAQTEDGLELIEVTVTGQTRTVMGIDCVVVHDRVTLEGELVEDTYDWYAQDDMGNIWYMGEDSKEYEGGKVISTAGSWEGGVDEAWPGIMMMANPLSGFSYRQEYYEGEAEDMAEIIRLDQTVKVGETTYDEVLVIREWNPLEPRVREDKYYAPDIGVIMEKIVVGDPEMVELVFTNLQ